MLLAEVFSGYTLSLVFILGFVLWRLKRTCGEGCTTCGDGSKTRVRARLLGLLARWLK